MATAPTKKRILVLGSGRVGRLVIRLLAQCGDYEVFAGDRSLSVAQAAIQSADRKPLADARALELDVTDRIALTRALEGLDYVISCCPFHLNLRIAQAARAAQVNYLDLTEDVATTKAVAALAESSDLCFVPQCGLAPGFVSIVAAHLAERFDSLDTVKLRVGALPLYPHNRFKYNLTWSTEGLINEYVQPCEAVVDGELTTVPPLQALETLSVDGTEYEAFSTSGGLGTLAESWAGKVKNLDYKSIRYPGHRELLAFLLDDLKFADDRDTLKRVFERSLPQTPQDVVIVFVTASGIRKGDYRQRSYVKKIYHGEVGGEAWGGIQITTASSVCAVLDLHVAGVLRQSGFLRQEEIPFRAFIENRFGRAFA